METPNTKAGRLTEEIMAEIRDHLKREPPPQESHHYNRVYEKVLAVLSRRAVVVILLALAASACVESPTAPTKTPLMILNPDLQGIA